MEIKNLITFVQVAQMQSFTKASEYLGYSQSTISFQIKQLEQEFNCSLFDRINHSINLTSAGEHLLAYALQIVQLNEEIKEMMLDASIKGEISIATSDSLATPLMEKHFPSFHQQYPDLTLKILTLGTDDMFKGINCNEVDAIITLDSHIYNHDYVVWDEQEIDCVFVCAPSFYQEDMQNLHQLVKYPFLLTEKGMSYRRIFDEDLAKNSLEVIPLLESSNTSLLASLCKKGLGIALLPKFVVEEAISKQELVVIKVKDFQISVWKQLILHKNKWISKPLQCFLEHFANN